MSQFNSIIDAGIILIIGVVFFSIVIAFIKRGLGTQELPEVPYQRKESLFTNAERSFLGVLDQAIDERLRVFGKVRVADVLSVKSVGDRKRWQQAFNRINAKHFDFVLCRASDLSLLAVIELDDQSHNQDRRKRRDDFLEEACQAADLPLIRIPAKRNYTVAELRSEIEGITAKGA
ncbi:hypothetical protein CKO13_06730 [Halorhodospira neutriphila]|uniref:DUF2726 domain-containing protein n=2 Tax=Halorhodospira neutriphila TaxID=168379 RepID=A0ABS1E4R4_9GAMM|nr:DUF2726 domain-containing protein [Halorhodospira neutriphila]MBK1726721.1 hypothetical protein [Halorhodospira neutriphila]